LSKSDIVTDGKNKCIHYGEIYTMYQPIIREVFSKTNINGNVRSLKGDVLVPATTTADALGIAVARSLNEDNVIIGGDINIIRTNNKLVLSDFLSMLISYPPLKNELAGYAKGANILHLSNSDLKCLKFPLPPLSVQEEIITELDSYQKIINGAKQVLDNWKPHIDIDTDWKVLKHHDVFTTIAAPQKIQTIDYKQSGLYPIIDQSVNDIAGWTDDERAVVKVDKPVVVFGDHTCRVKYTETNFCQGADGIKILVTTDSVLPKYLYYYLIAFPVVAAGYNRHFSKLKEKEIYVPDISIQRSIVDSLDSEKILVEVNRQLITIYEQKIKDRIDRLWSEKEVFN